MGLGKKILEVLGAAIVLGIVEWLFPGLAYVMILSGAFVIVVVLDGLVGLFRGPPIPGFLLLNLAMISAGLGFLVYGMWTVTNLETSGGVGSYTWVIAQMNILVGMLTAGMGFVFLKH